MLRALSKKTTDLHSLSCKILKGVGEETALRLARLQIYSLQDLLFHLPMRYQNRSEIQCIKNLIPGDLALISGKIVEIVTPKNGRTKLLITLFDGTHFLYVRFFNLYKTTLNTFQLDTILHCFGEVKLGANGLYMIHPEYVIGALPFNNKLMDKEHLLPIYPTTEGISQLLLRKLTNQALPFLNNNSLCLELIPAKILSQQSLPSLKEALVYVHRPPIHADLVLLEKKRHPTQIRLILEELLTHQLNLLKSRNRMQKQKAISLYGKDEKLQPFLHNLGFSLTNAQQKTISEIKTDLHKPYPMLRLLQGDVGSGKTVVAAAAILQAISKGYEAAILVPTEILAEQHFKTFTKWFAPLNIKIGLLKGAMPKKTYQILLEDIKNNEYQLIIGTHAIFQKKVIFNKLALIVIDEQHRFGVEQRALFREKGMVQSEYFPHQLILTATPIPRTLAMSHYTDLDFSIINELPPNRIPIETFVMSINKREEIIARIQSACDDGKQIYWVCTLIAESEILQCEAAILTYQKLQTLLPKIQIGLLHGKLKPTEKSDILFKFKEGIIQLLVATTVIEVGVDVPNASVMVIENAERLGLAQLHQLRGRIGRGSIKSYCLLLYQPPLSLLAKERLAVLKETNDGFIIAEHDLKLRGPGEVWGTKQAGEMKLRIAELIRDSDWLNAAKEIANELISHYPLETDLLIARWIGDKKRYEQV